MVIFLKVLSRSFVMANKKHLLNPDKLSIQDEANKQIFAKTAKLRGAMLLNQMVLLPTS
jgi:hypothetical protein